MPMWLAVGAASVVLGCGVKSPAPETIQNSDGDLKPVETATAVTASDSGQVKVTGTLASFREVVVSADVAETIVSWPCLEGDRVTKGQLISAQDDRAVRAQVSEVAAQATQARAEVKRLQAEYARASLETAAGIDAARSGIQAAEANRAKVATITRTQELRQSETRLAQAKADEELAKKELDRFTALVQGGAASQQTLDQVRSRFDVATQARISAEQGVSLAKEGSRMEDRSSATAAVDQARAVLNAARSRPSRLAAIKSGIEAAEAQAVAAEAVLRRTRILLAKHVKAAPFSGRVLKSDAELGMNAAPGTPLLTLGETTRLKLRFSVPEGLRSKLEGGEVTFTVPSLGSLRFRAAVREKGFLADPRTRTFSYEAVVPNPDETLLPGMVTQVTLNTVNRAAPEGGVSVPLGALVMDGTSATLYVVDASKGVGRVQVRRVLIAKRDGASALVRQGLRTGERVVLGPKNLADGEMIKVVNR